MTTSGSVNFSTNRDEMVKASLRKIGQLEGGESPSADDLTDAVYALNLMIKAMNANGAQLFAQQQATLFLQRGDHDYLVGPSGDHATHSYTSTQVKVAAVANATTIDVDSTTGMAASDYIGFVLDSGSFHWSTVSSVTDSDTVVIAAGLASAAAVDNYVYFYRTKMYRPLRILTAWTSNLTNNQDYPVEIYRDRESYFQRFSKIDDGQPSRIYYDPRLTNGMIYTNYEQTNVNEVLKFIYQRPAEDFDAATDNPDFPQEVYETLVYGLAIRLAPDYGVELPTRAALIQEASALGINVRGFYLDGPVAVRPTAF